MDEGKLCESQKAALNRRFAECSHITSKEKARLSLKLGLRRDEIAAWFLMMQQREKSEHSTGTAQASNAGGDDAKHLKMELDAKLNRMKMDFEVQIETLSSQIVDLKQSFDAKALDLKKDYLEKISTANLTIPNGHQINLTNDRENQPIGLLVPKEKKKEEKVTPEAFSQSVRKLNDEISKETMPMVNYNQRQKFKLEDCVETQNITSNRIKKKSVTNSTSDSLLKTIPNHARGPGVTNTEVEPNRASNEKEAKALGDTLDVSMEVMRQADLLLAGSSRGRAPAPPGPSCRDSPGHPGPPPSALEPPTTSGMPSSVSSPSIAQGRNIKQYASSCVHCNMLFRSTHQTATEKCYQIHLRQEHGIYDACRSN